MPNNWILPVFDGDTDAISGQCFIAGAYIITAAHIIETLSRPYIILDKERFELRRDNAYRFQHNPSQNMDCTIFHLTHEISSPLHFFDIEGVNGPLECRYVNYVHEANGSINIQLKSSSAQLIGIEGHAFLCSVRPMLNEGCSGSPLLAGDDQVVGMLVGGDDVNVCGFQRASFIQNLLNTLD